MITVTLPIYWEKVYKTKPNKVHLAGMNWFRNAVHFDQNKFKTDFTDKILEQVTPFNEPLSQFTVEYKLFYKNPSCDPSNIIALMEKVSLDAFKKANLIIDDNVKYHLGSSWATPIQDKDNPRCEITLKEVK